MKFEEFVSEFLGRPLTKFEQHCVEFVLNNPDNNEYLQITTPYDFWPTGFDPLRRLKSLYDYVTERGVD